MGFRTSEKVAVQNSSSSQFLVDSEPQDRGWQKSRNTKAYVFVVTRTRVTERISPCAHEKQPRRSCARDTTCNKETLHSWTSIVQYKSQWSHCAVNFLSGGNRVDVSEYSSDSQPIFIRLNRSLLRIFL
jgi:hypothetical protein